MLYGQILLALLLFPIHLHILVSSIHLIVEQLMESTTASVAHAKMAAHVSPTHRQQVIHATVQ